MKPDRRVLGACKAVTGGQTKGAAYRLAESMAEARVESQRRDGKMYEVVTYAKLRIFEDGSGLFEFRRGGETLALRWTEEREVNTDVFISINDEEIKMISLSDFPVETRRPA